VKFHCGRRDVDSLACNQRLLEGHLVSNQTFVKRAVQAVTSIGRWWRWRLRIGGTSRRIEASLWWNTPGWSWSWCSCAQEKKMLNASVAHGIDKF
jgi:hypothetical protein